MEKKKDYIQGKKVKGNKENNEEDAEENMLNGEDEKRGKIGKKTEKKRRKTLYEKEIWKVMKEEEGRKKREESPNTRFSQRCHLPQGESCRVEGGGGDGVEGGVLGWVKGW